MSDSGTDGSGGVLPAIGGGDPRFSDSLIAELEDVLIAHGYRNSGGDEDMGRAITAMAALTRAYEGVPVAGQIMPGGGWISGSSGSK
jgi:hypothetical protein